MAKNSNLTKAKDAKKTISILNYLILRGSFVTIKNILRVRLSSVIATTLTKAISLNTSR